MDKSSSVTKRNKLNWSKENHAQPTNSLKSYKSRTLKKKKKHYISSYHAHTISPHKPSKSSVKKKLKVDANVKTHPTGIWHINHVFDKRYVLFHFHWPNFSHVCLSLSKFDWHITFLIICLWAFLEITKESLLSGAIIVLFFCQQNIY